ncbi:hypothetical protein K2173_013349 [Erythroxylum novogranatense]|uniref:MATH domain-containing protein n=1 Tax=Erythroxylum novogranatense TaxID=1862640 RepID=A0AAV8S4C7_9ROSI|nr:hypothetical protein K2173_013349 [Erythroxylum novogranatense]
MRTKRDFPPKDFAIRIKQFSLLAEKHEKYESFTFEAGGYKWRIRLHPNGYGPGKGNSLSVYLQLIEAEKLGPTEKVWANFELRVLNIDKDRHVRDTFSHWYTFKEFHAFGQHMLMPLEDSREPFKDFVVNDTLTVEAELLFVTGAKVVS